MAFLEIAARPIAFIFGWEARGVIQPLKIGYDPAFPRFSPGHLLWYVWVQKLAEGHIPLTVDFLGPLTEGTRSWANGSYPIGRIIIASNWWGKCLLACYRAYRRFRGMPKQPDWLTQGTAPAPEQLGTRGGPASMEHVLT